MTHHHAKSPTKPNQDVIDNHWKHFSSAFQETVKESIGFRRSMSYPDCLQENIKTAEEKLYKMLIDHTHSDGFDYTNLLAKYKCVRNRVKNSIRRLQNKWWSNKTEELKHADA